MPPLQRKWIYAASYEVIGLIMASGILALVFSESARLGMVISAIMAVEALIWNVIYNSLFETWERRQSIRGRSVARRCLHAVLFEAGLTCLTVPVIMLLVNADLLDALLFDLGLTACYMVYTYVFTWTFDRLFGLPQSAL
jgi:uncharacterized membrane protein